MWYFILTEDVTNTAAPVPTSAQFTAASKQLHSSWISTQLHHVEHMFVDCCCCCCCCVVWSCWCSLFPSVCFICSIVHHLAVCRGAVLRWACPSACPSVRPSRLSGTTCPNVTKFSVCVVQTQSDSPGGSTDVNVA